MNWQTQAAITEDIAHPFTVAITAPYQQYPARRAEGLVEVRPPMPLRTFAWDAR